MRLPAQTKFSRGSLFGAIVIATITCGALAIFAASDASVRSDAFGIDSAKNGVTYTRKNGIPIVGIGVPPSITKNELDVLGYVRLDAPLHTNGNETDPARVVWSEGNIQFLTLANTNYDVIFTGPPVSTTSASDTNDSFDANLMLIVKVNANSAGQISGWQERSSGVLRSIRWRNNAAPTFVSTTRDSYYVVFFHATKEFGSTRVRYYGWY